MRLDRHDGIGHPARDLEMGNAGCKVLGFQSKRMGGRGGFLDHGRVLLRDLVKLVDRIVDPGQADRLLLGRIRHLGNQHADFRNLADQHFQRFAGLADQV